MVRTKFLLRFELVVVQVSSGNFDALYRWICWASSTFPVHYGRLGTGKQRLFLTLFHVVVGQHAHHFLVCSIIISIQIDRWRLYFHIWLLEVYLHFFDVCLAFFFVFGIILTYLILLFPLLSRQVSIHHRSSGCTSRINIFIVYADENTTADN